MLRNWVKEEVPASVKMAGRPREVSGPVTWFLSASHGHVWLDKSDARLVA